MNKYIYCIEKTYPLPATEEELNKMGSDGWELVSVLKHKEGNLNLETFFYYFKKLQNG